jgi:hypothetical protein
MSPLFGHTGNDEADDAALPAEVSRLNSLSVVQLATEVMTKGFGPGAPGADPDDTVTVSGPNTNAGTPVSVIATAFAPGGSTRGADDSVRLSLYRLVAEGLQALEHVSLIRAQLHTAMGSLDHAVTRLGQRRTRAWRRRRADPRRRYALAWPDGPSLGITPASAPRDAGAARDTGRARRRDTCTT